MNYTRHTLLLYVILLVSCTSGNKKSDSKEVAEKKDTVVEQKFVTDEYGFSVWYPDDWKHEVFEIGNNLTVINIYPARLDTSSEFPLTIHENANLSYISIFPGGYGTELPSGKSRRIDNIDEKPVAFDVNRNESLAFFLENNQVWGYFIVPSPPPASWSSHGFMFVQAAVNDFETKCFDSKTGKELEMSECNPLTGDSVARYGEVVEEDLQILKRILESFRFRDINDGQQSSAGDDAGGINVTTPQPGSVITSPLKIKGEAKGSWFFEALLEIELRKDGNTLASTTGKAKGNWMTSDFVEFSAKLNFPEVNEPGNAELLFRSSNPSGKKELEKLFKVPVVIEE